MIKVLVLRRDSLTSEELAQIQAAYPGQEIQQVGSDPQDYIQHAETCRQEKPDVVILPKDRPIPSVAMEEGFVHVAITPYGLMKLLPLKPEFERFEPAVPESAARASA